MIQFMRDLVMPYRDPFHLQDLDYLKFKHVRDRLLFIHLNPVCLKLLIEMANYTKSKGHVLTVTSTVSSLSEDKRLGRVSDTHLTRRAFDIRTRDMSERVLDSLVEEFSTKYSSIGAKNLKGDSRLIVNESTHLHVQLDRLFSEQPISETLWNWATKQLNNRRNSGKILRN